MSKDRNGPDTFAADSQVPILKADPILEGRLKVLSDHFEATFNVKPSFCVRVPGRVNLIGEHVDYCGYAVCPMAIEQNILVAVASSNDGKIRLTNINKKYKDFDCDIKSIDSQINDAQCGPVWYKYFMCGIKGALEVIPRECIPTGILAAVWGNIPPNSGLSSSSALVSAAVLSAMYVSQCHLPKEELATISAMAERHIGTQGGGMDQAIAFLGKAGSAKLIEFNPLRATDVTLPENAVFVIAHSLAYHNKASTADYNLRVAECRLAAQIISKKWNKDWTCVSKLVDIQKLLGFDLEKMIEVVSTTFHDEPYTLDEVSRCLDTKLDRLKSTSSLLSTFSVTQTFKLKQRSLHVFREANRVLLFRSVNEMPNVTDSEKIQQLGRLMTESHESLQKLYECSHPKVDALVDMAIECGAVGARVTGAGWGGCVVALVTKDNVSRFVEDLRNKLRRSQEGICPDLKNLVFPTEPNQGAAIYQY